jgi:AcrR family transcriptional regulator
MDTAVEARRPGRPRSVECDRAILLAALEEYAENGFDGMSVDAVAARAGVSKATIYRRFESKLELVTAAMYQSAEERFTDPDNGTLAADLRCVLESILELTKDPVLGRAKRMIVADGVRNPELGRVHEEFVQQRRVRIIDAFDRAIARGDMRPDIDKDVAADFVTGPVFYRHLVSHMPIDEAYITEVLDAFLRAYAR